ncbi:MAG TPA: hypothetical protein VE053_09395 [Allosphingosinicella sp.]|nr:hypothetical protein [Allosphingosinicella sp.]
MAAIYANHRLAGAEQSGPDQTPFGWQESMSFVPLAGGGYVAIWTDLNAFSTGHVYGRTYDRNGRPAGPEFTVDSGTSLYRIQVSSSPLSGGGFVVTWVEENPYPATFDVKAQRFGSDGQKIGGEIAINSTTDEFQTEPDIAGLPGGGFVAVWLQSGSTGTDVYRGRIFDSSGAPVTGEFIVSTGQVGDSYSAEVVALSGGGFLVAWNETVGGIRAQLFTDAGVKVGPVIIVDAAVGGSQFVPVVASLPSGGFVVAWSDDSGGAGARIRAQVFDSAGAKVGSEFAVTPGSPNAQTAPTIAANAAGEFLIGWTEFVQFGEGDVKARLFSASGTPIGDSFTVNTLTQGSQNLPQATALATGGFVIGWDTPGLFNDSHDANMRVFFPVMRGTSGNDTLVGGSDRDFIDGLEGNDQLSGGLDDDGLFGDLGNDSLDGGDGNDELQGGEGDDTLTGGAGNDLLEGGAGNDGLDGGDGDDVLRVSGAGSEAAMGGAQNDLLIVDYSDLTTEVTSTALSSGGQSGSILAADRFVSFTGIERLQISTGSGNDDIRTGAGDDIVSLGAGDDRVDIGTGLGRADGGTGIDGIAADLSALGQFSWSLQSNFLAVNNTMIPSDTFKGFEYFIAIVTGFGNQSLDTTALALDDDMTTGAGDDRVSVNHGHDVWRAGTGSDSLSMDYSGATTAILTTGFTASADGTGYDGAYVAGDRSVVFTGVETVAIAGGSGNDVIRTGAGNDSVYGGDGDDFIDVGSAGLGGDTAFGGDGVDGISADVSWMPFAIQWNLVTGVFGSPAFFVPFGGFEYLGTLTTGTGNDNIVTSNLDRDEQINTGIGNDNITVMNGDDVVNAGSGGTDTLIVDYRNTSTAIVSGALTASAGGGHDGRIAAGDRAVDFTGIETFQIFGGSAADDLKGGAGNDRLNGGGGIDTMAGGLGNDIYTVDDAADVVIENPGEGIDTITTALAVYSLVGRPDIENLSVTGFIIPRDFRGNSGNNVISGGSTSDVLRLYDGGDDTVNGAIGNDTLFFIGSLTAADVVNGGDGVDTLVIQGPYGSLALSANVTQIENVSILGGNNINFGEPGTNRYDYVLTTNDANFAAGVQARINGAALLEGEDFTFDGSAETDAKYVVYGGKGKDTLTGGLGADIFFYAEERFASGDVVNGGAGYDGMFLRGNYTIDFTAPGYTGLFTSIENLTLTSATDERYARGGGTEFDYNLILSNAIVKPGEQLTISGTLLMASETMVLDASQEADGLLRLFGGKAGDTLKGGGQADLLHGGLGADILAGNGGADAFRFQAVEESNAASMDQILDFTPGTDKIELDRIDANTLVGGDQGFSWIGSNAFSGSAGQLRAYQQGGTWFVEGDVNGDGVADLVIALTLQGPTPLSAGDFLL